MHQAHSYFEIFALRCFLFLGQFSSASHMACSLSLGVTLSKMTSLITLYGMSNLSLLSSSRLLQILLYSFPLRRQHLDTRQIGNKAGRDFDVLSVTLERNSYPSSFPASPFDLSSKPPSFLVPLQVAFCLSSLVTLIPTLGMPAPPPLSDKLKPTTPVQGSPLGNLPGPRQTSCAPSPVPVLCFAHLLLSFVNCRDPSVSFLWSASFLKTPWCLISHLQLWSPVLGTELVFDSHLFSCELLAWKSHGSRHDNRGPSSNYQQWGTNYFNILGWGFSTQYFICILQEYLVKYNHLYLQMGIQRQLIHAIGSPSGMACSFEARPRYELSHVLSFHLIPHQL